MLPNNYDEILEINLFQCPHGLELLPNNYDEILEINLFQCPHGLELLRKCTIYWKKATETFQCPHGLELLLRFSTSRFSMYSFNALTGLSCYGYYSVNRCSNVVSMPSRAYTSFLPVLCQSDWGFTIARVNALSGLYLISTVPLQKPRFYAVSRTCFCRYLSEYSDNSCFSCMLTFWTYLMRCTYP